VSTLVAFALALQMVALPLFVFTADRLAAQLSGAMCAVGTFNANAYGFPALLAQIVAFFASAAWLALDAMDVSVPSYPLTRPKYVGMLLLAPVLVAASGMLWVFFVSLEPDVITSCCARVFASGADTVSGSLAALPPRRAMGGFFVGLSVAAGLHFYVATGPRGPLSAALAGASGLAAFGAAVAGIVSFVAPAVYNDVLHHCPFCILKAEYSHQGYLIYVPLFTATASSVWVLCAAVAAGVPSLRLVLPDAQRRWAAVAAVGYVLVAVVSAIMVAWSPVTFP
jgi:hypothetical protein